MGIEAAIIGGAVLAAGSAFHSDRTRKRELGRAEKAQEKQTAKLEADLKTREQQEAASRASEMQARRRRLLASQAGGQRRDTILTSPLGVAGPASTTAGYRTILGA